MYNPFKENRTEQMKDLWKYYVPILKIVDESNKPLVLEGGRGSGKTMLFVCNSWREKTQQFSDEGKDIEQCLKKEPFIGMYYRVDTAFVSAMFGDDRNDWDSIFETYLAICFLRELLEFIIRIKNIQKVQTILDEKLLNFIHAFSKRFIPASTINTIDDFLNETNLYLDIIEDIVNRNTSGTNIRFIKLHRFLVDICNSINDLLGFKQNYKIFIDEYETLQISQQRLVNTLIKHSSYPVVFNIGLKLEGMKTNKTIAETETIEAPHDFESFSIDSQSIDYIKCLKMICQKRIQHGKAEEKIPQCASDDISFYLGEYDIDDEIKLITNSKKVPAYLDKLREIIKSDCYKKHISQEDELIYINTLCDNISQLNSLIHYSLLKKETFYRPSIEELYNACINNTDKYKEWIHTRRIGAIFLLAKNYNKKKMYFGFDVFSALSSGTIRYFLELCEQAFNNAFFNSNFDWDSKISISDQSNAAKYVSKYKIEDISTYIPKGNEMNILVQSLGYIFNYLHVSDNINLSEPEQNHFSTDDLALTSENKEIISSSIMWNVLQIREPTKRKHAEGSLETRDYYLNKIYTPYFNISYRDQRKVEFPIKIIKDLLSGNIDIARKAQNSFLKQKYENDEINTKLQQDLFNEELS
jgi:hypothetical protein